MKISRGFTEIKQVVASEFAGGPRGRVEHVEKSACYRLQQQTKVHVLACVANLFLKTAQKDVVVESVCLPYMVMLCLPYLQPKYSLKFEQIYLSKPTHWEKDGAPVPLMPNEARIRNLT